MKQLSNQTLTFIQEQVLPNLGYQQITDENIGEIVDYIIDNYEVPLAQAQEAGEAIDQTLLDLATATVTEITSSEDW